MLEKYMVAYGNSANCLTILITFVFNHAFSYQLPYCLGVICISSGLHQFVELPRQFGVNRNT